MTLIITALCKNGICVCADKRSSTWSGNTKVNVDNLIKIFHFKDAPIMIFNHGVNKFNGKFWDAFCSNYQLTNRWRNKNLKEIALDFKEFIEKDLLGQLSQNAKIFPDNASVVTSAFVICGKDSSSGRFEFHELYWSPKFLFSSWTDKRLIGSGEGYNKYLDGYLRKNPQSNSIEFWSGIDIAEARNEIKKLFLIALNEQKMADGDDFSDNFDMESIPS